MAVEEKVDVHAHFLPPFYRRACIENGHQKPDGFPVLPEWSEESHLDFMRQNSIVKSILSISSPGVHLKPDGEEYNSRLARQCNDFADEIVQRRPDEFGFWAVLPLPSVDCALLEIRRATQHLQHSGFILETNYHGIYLGDALFDPVFQELNKLKATVFIHPTTPCCRSMGNNAGHRYAPVTFLPQFPNPLMEFMFDTARALINVISSGTLRRCPDITFVAPHAGGALPVVFQRYCTFAIKIMRNETDLSARELRNTLRTQFYFDLAGLPFPDHIHGLLSIVGHSRLLYGSDYPFTPSSMASELAKALQIDVQELFEGRTALEEIFNANARRLLQNRNS